MTAEEIKALLGLSPHALEGGDFVETYRSRESLPPGIPDPARAGVRSLATAIYYLLTPGTFSALHRLRSDEIFHFYLGDPVEMLQLAPGGEGRVVVLGTDLAAGMRPQVLVPHGTWQGTRLVAGGSVALLGTTVSPGFEVDDYEHGRREELLALYPAWAERIQQLTR